MKAPEKKEAWGWYEAKYEMAEFILGRLIKYKVSYNREGQCIPAWVLDKTAQKEQYSDQEVVELTDAWNKELDKMISAFTQILNYKQGADPKLIYNETAIQSGLDAFSKYFLHFWD